MVNVGALFVEICMSKCKVTGLKWIMSLRRYEHPFQSRWAILTKPGTGRTREMPLEKLRNTENGSRWGVSERMREQIIGSVGPGCLWGGGGDLNIPYSGQNPWGILPSSARDGFTPSQLLRVDFLLKV